NNNYVKDLAEDSDGNIWVVTLDGLAMYDRVKDRFLRFKYDPADSNSLASNIVNKIHYDSDGRLWIATHEGSDRARGGLNYYSEHDRRFVHLEINSRFPFGKEDVEITEIFEDSQKQMWIGTSRNGLYLYDRKTERITNYNNILHDSTSLS